MGQAHNGTLLELWGQVRAADVDKILGGNVLRVLEANEQR